jgi:RNA polymerase sigma-70 factor (ECF subfamily)
VDELVITGGVATGEILSDDALVRRAQAGDVAAFEVLVATRIDRCYRIAWSILRNDADAADATQDGFVAAWRQLPNLREPAAFDGWLNRVVANKALAARRRPVRIREIQMHVPEGGTPEDHHDPADRGIEDDVVDAHAVALAFDRLRPDQRLVLVLRYVEDLPVADVARTLGIPEGTVKSRLFAARHALEEALEAEA